MAKSNAATAVLSTVTKSPKRYTKGDLAKALKMDRHAIRAAIDSLWAGRKIKSFRVVRGKKAGYVYAPAPAKA